jgi:hypothetical protein
MIGRVHLARDLRFPASVLSFGRLVKPYPEPTLYDSGRLAYTMPRNSEGNRKNLLPIQSPTSEWSVFKKALNEMRSQLTTRI